MELSVTEFIGQLKELFESGSSLDAIKAKFGELSGNVVNFSTVVSAAARTGKDFTTSLSSGIDQTSKAGKSLNEFIETVRQGMIAAKYSTLSLGAAMASIAPAAIAALRPFESLSNITRDASEVTAQMGDLSSTLNQAGLLRGPMKYAADLLTVGDAARNMENQIIMNMSAAGQMDKMMLSMGGNFDGLNKKVNQFSTLTADIGSATGLTAKQVATLANRFMQIPGVLDQVVKTSGPAGEAFHMLDAAIRVARGTGQSFTDVQEDIIVMTQEFGASVQNSVETISRMYSATQRLGLNLKDMRSYVKDTGEQFKFFGDNSSSALDIMNKFAPALTKSGLGPAAVTQIVKGFTHGVAQMTVAQRAFLASQSGIGGGGLRGGLQVEQMLEEGKVGDLVGKIEESLKKLAGGKILTRKEAIAGGPGAASQFEFQRKLLQQGPFGQLAGSSQEASKMLEALASGQRGEISEKLMSGQAALSETVATGTKLGERQNNLLISANNELSKIANWQSQIAADAARVSVGIKGFLAGKQTSSDLQVKAKAQSQQKMVTGQKIQGGKTPAEFADDLTKAISNKMGLIDKALKKIGFSPSNKTAKEEEGTPPVKGSPGKPVQKTYQHPIPLDTPVVKGVTTPQRPTAAIAQPVQQMAANNAAGSQRPADGHQGTGSNNAIKIYVMSKEDVIEEITVQLDKYGRMMRDKGQGNEYKRTVMGTL